MTIHEIDILKPCKCKICCEENHQYTKAGTEQEKIETDYGEHIWNTIQIYKCTACGKKIKKIPGQGE